MLPSGPSQIIQQAKFTYSPLRKAFKNRKIELQSMEINKQKQSKIKE